MNKKRKDHGKTSRFAGNELWQKISTMTDDEFMELIVEPMRLQRMEEQQSNLPIAHDYKMVRRNPRWKELTGTLADSLEGNHANGQRALS